MASHQFGADGSYAATLTVTDDDGGSVVESATLTVAAGAPVVTQVLVSSSLVAENSSVTVTGSFTDSALDTHSVVIEWGDGTSSPATVDQAANTFTATHTYLDDDPTGTASDVHVVVAKVTDNGALTGTGSTSITVTNVDPVLTGTPLASASIDADGLASVSGSFGDVGSLDTHTVTIVWGDGSSSEATVD